MSDSMSYKCAQLLMRAVLTAPELAINMPSTNAEWEVVRRGWLKKSKLQLLSGTVGAVDGFFQRTIKPEVANCQAFFSGHYQSYGLNCQAACDSNLKFIYFGIIATGCTNDGIAFHMADNLANSVKNLPDGMYFVGDAAYDVTEKLLIPFTGSQRENPDNDAFNYYLSQMRIWIEMSFGYLVNNFRILQGKLNCKIENNAKILMACARLHNFIIDTRSLGEDGNDADSDSDDSDIDVDYLQGQFDEIQIAPMNMVYLPVIPDGNGFDAMNGVCFTRMTIVDMIRENGIRRPVFNLIRNGRAAEAAAQQQQPQQDDENDGNDDEAIEGVNRNYYHPN